MDMKRWAKDAVAATIKKPMPVLSFPSIQLLGISVPELISDGERQARGMKAIADRVDALASLSMMDLSVEAECFGSNIRFSDDEVPTVVGGMISTPEDAEALAVPAVGTGRTGIYIEAIRQAAKLIGDRPVFAGTIGPFSLAGRLMDVSEAMIFCYDEPEMVHTVLQKVTAFLIEYAKAYKAAGANGVVIAEPLAGLLSPSLSGEFSAPYCKRIVDALQDDEFAVIYHNCGPAAIDMIGSILSIGAAGYHFGNAIKMADMMPHIPAHIPVFGNVDPARQFRNGTPESVREATLQVLEECSHYPNFIISSGCDVPPLSKWENIDAFFAAAREFYAK